MEIILFILIQGLDNQILVFCFSLEDILSRLNVLDVQQKQFAIKITGEKAGKKNKNQIAFKLFKNFLLAH